MTAVRSSSSSSLSLPFLAVLVRRPVLRRLAFRNAVRRPREAALVVLGSLLGAAIITGSVVVGDTMDASIRQVARTHLGPIDELVSAREPRRAGAAPPRAAAARARTTSTGCSRSRRSTPPSRRPARASSRRRARRWSRSTSKQRARFGGDTDATGVSGRDAAARPRRDQHRPRPRARGRPRATDRRPRLRAPDRSSSSTGSCRAAGSPGSGSAPSRRRTTSSSRRGRSTGSAPAAGAASPPTWAIAVSNRGGVESGARAHGRRSRARSRRRRRGAGSTRRSTPRSRTTLDAADAVGKGVHLDVHGDGQLRRARRPAAARQPLRDARRRAEDRARDGAGRRHAPLASSSARSRPRAGSTRSPRRRSASSPGSGSARVLVAVSARIFSTEHNRFDLFFTLQAAEPRAVVRDRLHGRARDDRRSRASR